MARIALPPPRTRSETALEEALEARRSVRSFSSAPLTIDELAQLLWAAQGITGPENERTAPSAGATFPIEIYLVAAAIEGVSPGVYRYLPLGHSLEPVEGLGSAAQAGTSGDPPDVRPALMHATGGQEFIGVAPLVIAVAAVRVRTRKLYGERAVRYVDMEAGAVLQNAALQGVALGLGSVVVGAFRDEEVKTILGIEGQERFLAMLVVGRQAK
jgi:SagB-type dehydrogenase family enzyme